MKILMVAVGKVRTPYFRDGCEDYVRRARKLIPIEVREVKTGKGENIESIKNSEGKHILAALSNIAFKTAVLHDRGESLSSERFARWLKELESSGSKGLAFILGGAWGVGKNVLEKADFRWSLGPMTMSHELTRLVLLEQIYRAETTLRGVPYPK